MIISGPLIQHMMNLGMIRITPAPPDENFGPNSVDLHIGDKLLVYEVGLRRHERLLLRNSRFIPAIIEDRDCAVEYALDTRSTPVTHEIGILESGTVLFPGVLYLAATIEVVDTATEHLLPHYPPVVPYIDGRSSTGRFGISMHITAGRGDVGFRGQWTLEIQVVHPVIIYPNQRLLQMTFMQVYGEIKPYDGRYQDSSGPIASRLAEGTKP